MTKFKQDSNGKGSLKDLQLLINQCPDLIYYNIIHTYLYFSKDKIVWLSPLKNDNFSEYNDMSFIELLGLTPNFLLYQFWPTGGPHWDGLGISKNKVFLLEAKANIPEIVTDPSRASNPTSNKLIQKSLLEVKSFLNIKNDIDWSGKFYQYTNRIAHLYYLRVLNGIDAYLVNIYFLNDKDVNGPKTKEEWQSAITVMKKYLGVGKNKLSKYMLDVFIDVNEMK